MAANESPFELWQVDIYPAAGQPDRLASEIAASAAEMDIAGMDVCTARGFLIQGQVGQQDVQQIVQRLLVEPTVEHAQLARVGDPSLACSPNGKPNLFHVLPKPGVTDPQAESTLRAIRQLGFAVTNVRTFRKYWISQLGARSLRQLANRLLANDAIEEVICGPLVLNKLQLGQAYCFEKQSVPLLSADDAELRSISAVRQLSLSLAEMRAVQDHFQLSGRDPTDVELETIAQTWSEHCSHKTLAGRIDYRDENGHRRFENMLKETIFAATEQIRHCLGDKDWCISVFKDNAGIVRFDDEFNIAFKVETHNRPSALEPYGGASTGIGGVIRDTLGTGLGAKPICSTDVFCFASPDTPLDQLPPGVLHPRRVIRGVVAGVRDYGNRMGIPTVNGAVYFDQRYVANPLVFCGNVGLIPHKHSFKQARPGDWIVSVGGRTGRDGIHGATFSSAELTDQSEETSGGAVQIGNPITEKMLLDVLLRARDQGLYNAITDCGAGGFSSAVGEMGADIGAVVWLDKAPLKYEGLSYTEIWISEAQERMVLAVEPGKWHEFQQLCQNEDVEATIVGRFEPTGRLQLKYHDHLVADLEMEFLHEGRPRILREAVFHPPLYSPWLPKCVQADSHTQHLLRILATLNVASKHWIIRQYDHEVQGGSVIKPLVGANNDGPSDAAVVRPVLGNLRGIAIACGMNPHYGDLDPFHMAASAIDEAVRNCVAVGANPSRIAILDNFCWGHTDRAETLGSLVRAALGCHHTAVSLGTPFISGKDSLHNEFSYTDARGERRTICIPASLLISAVGQIDDVRRCVTMDLKSPDSAIYLLGNTADEVGGSHLGLVTGDPGGMVPTVDAAANRRLYIRLHRAMGGGLVRSAHDLSEGGLAVAIGEMAFAGGLGAEIDVQNVRTTQEIPDSARRAEICLFAESNGRLLVEVEKQNCKAFESLFDGLPCALVGRASGQRRLVISQAGDVLIDADIDELKTAWQKPLDWD